MARDRTAAPAQVARFLGALLLIGSGAVHLQQYFAVYYEVIPVIGPLFLANFALALALGLLLLAPIGRLGSWAPALVAAGGIIFAAGTIIGLEISEFGTLFGFHEHGYRPAIVLSIIFEGAAIVLLASYLAGPRPRNAGTHANTPAPAASPP